MKTAALDLARERQAHEAGARTRATAHERTPQQERQKAAREAERGREAWTLGQGMKKPVAGCYGRLTRWKGGGDVGCAPAAVLINRHPFSVLQRS